MNVGAQIKTAREQLGISQVELAERLEVAPGTVSKWEQNQRTPSIVMFTRISGATDKPLAFFFEDGKDAA